MNSAPHRDKTSYGSAGRRRRRDLFGKRQGNIAEICPGLYLLRRGGGCYYIQKQKSLQKLCKRTLSDRAVGVSVRQNFCSLKKQFSVLFPSGIDAKVSGNFLL